MANPRLLTQLALLLLMSLSQPAAAQTLLRVATPGALTGALPIYLGAKKGLFQKYGLTVEVIATDNLVNWQRGSDMVRHPIAVQRHCEVEDLRHTTGLVRRRAVATTRCEFNSLLGNHKALAGGTW